jgi:co-chaperonin GroES (HSP10)
MLKLVPKNFLLVAWLCFQVGGLSQQKHRSEIKVDGETLLVMTESDIVAVIK